MCSIGLAPNKLLAKIASDLDKPDGFCVLHAGGDAGRGRRPAGVADPRRRARRRPSACAAPGSRPSPISRRAPDEVLAGVARGWARSCATRANGIDDRARADRARARSPRAARRRSPQDVVRPRRAARRRSTAWPRALCEGCGASGYRGRTVTLKIRLRPFRTYTRSQTLEVADPRGRRSSRRRARAARPGGAGRAGAAAGRRAVELWSAWNADDTPPVRRGVALGRVNRHGEFRIQRRQVVRAPQGVPRRCRCCGRSPWPRR